jgi:hypothetical protein
MVSTKIKEVDSCIQMTGMVKKIMLEIIIKPAGSAFASESSSTSITVICLAGCCLA